jgi:hypothetical protein
MLIGYINQPPVSERQQTYANCGFGATIQHSEQIGVLQIEIGKRSGLPGSPSQDKNYEDSNGQH